MAVAMISNIKSNSDENKITNKILNEFDLIKRLGEALGKEALLMFTLSNVINELSYKLEKVNDLIKQLDEDNSNWFTRIVNPTENMNPTLLSGVSMGLLLIGITLPIGYSVADEDHPLIQKAMNFVGSRAQFLALMGSSLTQAYIAAYKLKYIRAKSLMAQLNTLIDLYKKYIDLNTQNNDKASESMKSLTQTLKSIIQACYDAETKKLYFK